jgi:hypothetical protein
MRFLLILLLSMATRITVAQTFEWAASEQLDYSLNPSYPEFAVDYNETTGQVVFSRLDSVALIYGSAVYGPGRIEIRDSSGNFVNAITLGPLANVQRMVTNAQGDILVGGVMRATLQIGTSDSIGFISAPISGSNTFLFKISASGTVLWKRNLYPTWPTFEGIEALDTDPSGACWYAMSDFFTVIINQTDNAGNDSDYRSILNAKRIGNISFDPTGAMYVSGAAESGNFVMDSDTFFAPHAYNMFICRYDAAGNPSWAYFGADITFQKPMVVADNSGNSFFAGYRYDTTSFNNYFFNDPYLFGDFFAFKTDSSGNILWGLAQPPLGIGPYGMFEPGPNRCTGVDAAGNFYLGGLQRGTVDWGGGYISSTNTYTDIRTAVTKILPGGQVEWVKLGGSASGNNMHALDASNGGSVYLVGGFRDTAMFDSLFIPTSNWYNSVAVKIGPGSFTGIPFPDKTEITLFPNPTTGTLYLSGAEDGAILEITDANGRLHGLIESTDRNDPVMINSNLTPGVYMLKITGSKSIRMMRFVVAW